jgi:uncharacterized membrane protein YccC
MQKAILSTGRINVSRLTVNSRKFLEDWFPLAWRQPIAFAVRTWLASILALFFAFFLQLDEPYWAGMAVWLVAQPTPGMTLSRSFYSILGTAMGTTIGVVLIALFSQTPELFILALGLWMGACTVVSNLLRNFRAYGFVLAGYTAAIVSLAAYNVPNSVFDIAMARGAATIIGILCSALSVFLFARHTAGEKVIVHLRDVIRTCAVRAAFPLTRTVGERIALGAPLVSNLITLETELEFAAAESAEVRIHVATLRGLIAHLFQAISAKRSLEAHLNRVGMIADQETIRFYREAMRVLEYAPRLVDLNQWEDLLQDIRAIEARLTAHSPEATDVSSAASSRLVLDRLGDLLRDFEAAIESCCAAQEGWKSETSLRLNFHRDHRSALINGARACLAILAAGTFWIASAWPSGSLMLILVAVVCSLFSATPHPDKAGTAFLKGAICAAAAAFVCNFFLLENVDGFLLFALALGICLVPIAIGIPNRASAAFATGYCVLFMLLSRPLNYMNYNVVSFLNNALAIIAGVAFGALTYQLFLPPNPNAARRYVVNRIRRGLRILSQRKPVPPFWTWQTRMFDRVHRLFDPENLSGTHTSEWFEGGLDALNLGNELLRIRILLETENLTDKVSSTLNSIIGAFAWIVHDQNVTRAAIRVADAALRNTTPPKDAGGRRAWYRALGSVEEMNAFFNEHPRFLTLDKSERV